MISLNKIRISAFVFFLAAGFLVFAGGVGAAAEGYCFYLEPPGLTDLCYKYDKAANEIDADSLAGCNTWSEELTKGEAFPEKLVGGIELEKFSTGCPDLNMLDADGSVMYKMSHVQVKTGDQIILFPIPVGALEINSDALAGILPNISHPKFVSSANKQLNPTLTLEQVKKAIQLLQTKTCCVPKDPDAGLKCGVAELTDFVKSGLNDKNIAINSPFDFKQIENWINPQNPAQPKWTDLFKCPVPKNILGGGYALYTDISCSSPSPVEAPSDKYNQQQGGVIIAISGYCGRSESYQYCACDKEITSCYKTDKANELDCQKEATQKFGAGAFCQKTIIGHSCSFKKGGEYTGPTGLSNEELKAMVKGLHKLQTTDIRVLIGNAIRVLMGIMGSIALAMFTLGGIMFMTASGNAEKTKKGINIVVWSGLGLIVIVSSYALVDFILKVLK